MPDITELAKKHNLHESVFVTDSFDLYTQEDIEADALDDQTVIGVYELVGIKRIKLSTALEDVTE